LITRETDYALRAMLYLAKQGEQSGSISTAELSEEMDIPYRFLRKIVSKLVSAELVLSRRGKGGGLSLARLPKAISLYDVVKAVDPDSIVLNRCLADNDCCNRSGFCGVHAELARMQDVLDKGLRNATLAGVAKHEA
jgi:Rrf2 family iron-sulfur cluster assembly transcriptional regulator